MIERDTDEVTEKYSRVCGSCVEFCEMGLLDRDDSQGTYFRVVQSG